MNLPSLRATARIARRQARLSPARSILVMLLVALPIAGLAGAGNVISTAIPSLDERASAEMGTAELRLTAWGDGVGAAEIEPALPPGSRVVVQTFLNREQVVRGSHVYMQFVEAPVSMDEEPVRGIFWLLEGRAPRAPGEAVVYPQVLRTYGIRIGDRLVVDDISVVVTGTAVLPLRRREPVSLVAPGTFAGRTDTSAWQVLIDLPPGADVAETVAALYRLPSLREAGDGVVARSDVGRIVGNSSRFAMAFSFAGAVAGLFATGLIVAAAFAVGLRRQLRMLGLIGAAGADARQVRAVVLLTGSTLGLAGSIAGVAIAVAATYAAAPHLGELTGSLAGPVTLNFGVMLGALVLGTAGATLAAAAPAATAARLSTNDALATRMPASPPPKRSARLGMGLAVAGAVVIAGATVAGEGLGLAIGMIAIMTGGLFTIPLLVSWLGNAASRLPTVWRLAARDTARYGRRTSAALAAASMALVVPVAVSAISLSDDVFERRHPTLGAEHLLLEALNSRNGAAIETLREPLAQAFPGSLLAAIRTAVFPPGSYTPPPGVRPNEPWGVIVQGEPRLASGPNAGVGAVEIVGGELVVASEDLVAALDAGAARRALAQGKVVALDPRLVRDGELTLLMPPRADGSEHVKKLAAEGVATERSFGDLLPKFLVSEQGAARLGLASGTPYRYLFDAPRPLTPEDIVRAKEIVSDLPSVIARDAADLGSPGRSALRRAVTGASAGLALAIVAVAVALVRAEARRDQAILAAVGGSPATRRRLAGASAALLAALAGIIAAPVGFGPVAIVLATRESDAPVVVPWLAILTVVVIVPVLAGLGAALVSRNPRSSAMLEPVV